MSEPTEHPTSGFEDIVHQPNRLGILMILHEANRADFTYLRSALGLTDGNLGRHLDALEQAGLVVVTKGFEGRRTRTWVRLSPAGRKALSGEIAAMRQLLRRFDA